MSTARAACSLILLACSGDRWLSSSDMRSSALLGGIRPTGARMPATTALRRAAASSTCVAAPGSLLIALMRAVAKPDSRDSRASANDRAPRASCQAASLTAGCGATLATPSSSSAPASSAAPSVASVSAASIGAMPVAWAGRVSGVDFPAVRSHRTHSLSWLSLDQDGVKDSGMTRARSSRAVRRSPPSAWALTWVARASTCS